MEENNMAVDETVDQNVEESTNPEISTSNVETNPVKQAQPVQKAADTSWRELREKAERAQRERDELEQRLKAYESQQTQPDDDDFNIGLGENDLAEGKHLKAMQKSQKKLKMDFKRQQEELLKAQKQTQELLIETRLKADHPDIDKVVTKENMDRLAELEPEIAYTLNSSTDYYSKAKTAYKMMKTLGIYKEDTYGNDRELAQKNAAKPRPLASVSPQMAESPLSHANAFANGLTEELKVQLRKEMEEAVRNL